MHDSTHEGWPVLKNAKGMYCYRYTPGDKWITGSKHDPAKGTGTAYIVAKEGPLPFGAHTWRVTKGGWKDRTLTVGLIA